MTNSCLADTSAVLAYLEGNLRVLAIFNQSDKVYVPAIVAGELYVGVEKCRNPIKDEMKVSEFLSMTQLLHVDHGTALIYAKIVHQLDSDGMRIPSNDCWIAALGMQYDTPVISLDQHFQRIQSLPLHSISKKD